MADTAGEMECAMSDVVSRLALDRFRSWSQIVVDFEPGVNVLYGRNGIGKTNLVEALEFLSVGSSPRASAAKYLVQHGQTNAVIRANATKTRGGCVCGFAGVGISGRGFGSESTSIDGADVGGASVWEHTLQVTIPVRGAVRSRVDSGSSKYFHDIAGMVRVVAFGPQDQQLAAGDPAGRRRFLDQSATLMFPEYYATLQRFHQIARQRAAVLHSFGESGLGFAGDLRSASSGSAGVESVRRRMAAAELEAWTSQFIDAGMALTRMRAAVVDRFNGLFAQTYADFAGGVAPSGSVDSRGAHADARLKYQPSFTEALESDSGEAKQRIAQHFQRIYPGEVSRETNLIGPQRDEMLIVLDGEPAREFASNGELWAIGLAMRLAQFQYLSGNVSRETVSVDAPTDTASTPIFKPIAANGTPLQPPGSARNGTQQTESRLADSQKDLRKQDLRKPNSGTADDVDNFITPPHGESNYPILVLDDVFAQLDEFRRERILDFAEHQGQVFLTVAAKGDVPSGSAWHGINVEKYAEHQHDVS